MAEWRRQIILFLRIRAVRLKVGKFCVQRNLLTPVTNGSCLLIPQSMYSIIKANDYIDEIKGAHFK
ncbi:MAG: hypothetical protein K0Q73_6787 [Paenibacillus sp.]|nr:hypothetical protein [Paenibacillus sp.]